MVSVVVPLYNNAAYLPECIESILSQTYRNWECIVLNNCSTDGSLEILEGYAEKDHRIIIKSNRHFLSAEQNHNAALRYISSASKYTKMVFADDWVYPECLEKMVEIAEASESVGLVSAYVLEGKKVICTGLHYSIQVLSGLDVCRMHLLDKIYLFHSSNAVLYRSDIVRKRIKFFDESNTHADTEVCFDILSTYDFGFVHQVLTCTRVRADSIDAFSKSVQSHYSGLARILKNHGHKFLQQEELEGLKRIHISNYYKFLGKSVLLGRDAEFWGFHKKELAIFDEKFNYIRLAFGVIAAMRDAVCRPELAWKQLRSFCSRRLW